MKSLLTRTNQFLVLPLLVIGILYIGKPVLVPVCFAILLAMLMAPVCRFLDGKGWNRALSCTACILILLFAIITLIGVVVLQVADFAENADKIRKQATQLSSSAKKQVESWFGVSVAKQDTILQERAETMKQTSSGQAGKVLAGVAATLGGAAITLVFTFLLLFHKEKYEKFFLKLYPNENETRKKKILEDITKVSRQYLVGRLLSMAFLFILYLAALLIIGIENALLLSVIAAMLTIVPYVGPIVGGLFPFMTALVTEDSSSAAIWVLGSIIVIQAIDNYFVEPNVIGGEVRLTALATILAILVGGIIWGIAGMILFIPLVSVAKIIFDNVEKLKPFGYVIGDEGKSPSSKLKALFGKK